MAKRVVTDSTTLRRSTLSLRVIVIQMPKVWKVCLPPNNVRMHLKMISQHSLRVCLKQCLMQMQRNCSMMCVKEWVSKRQKNLRTKYHWSQSVKYVKDTLKAIFSMKEIESEQNLALQGIYIALGVIMLSLLWMKGVFLVVG